MNKLNKPIDIRIHPKGYVALTITGDLTSDDAEAFDADLRVGAETIRQFSEKEGHKVKVLMDVSAFTGVYDAASLQGLVDLASGDTPFVEKSASFGGTDKVKAAGEVVTALAERNNIAIFDTKEKALAWLGI